MAWEARSGLKHISLSLVNAPSDVGMAWEARSGLKRSTSLQWHLFQKRRSQAHPDPSKRPQGLQVSVQYGGCLLECRDGQLFGDPQMDIVGVIADVAMGAPGSLADTLDLPMRGQASQFAHKAKRRRGRQ